MKRRAFFGLMGGAAVAGPQMVKQAAAKGLADLSLSGVAGNALGAYEYEGVAAFNSTADHDTTHYANKLSALQRLIKSGDWLRRKKDGWHCQGLDPDIAAFRSLSLGAKLRMQREREFNRWLAREQSWLERQILGERDEY